MSVRNPTKWAAPGGTGFINPSTGADIATQSGVTLETQSGINLQINGDIYTPKYAVAWVKSTKNKTQWTPESGAGYVVTVGNELFVTNLGSFLVTNDGKNLITTPTYNIPKYATNWAASGL